MNHWLKLVTAGGLGAKAVVKDKALIFRHGARAEYAYVLASGAIEILQADEPERSIIVKVIAGPSMFGVIEPVAGEATYLETVRSAGRSVIYSLPRASFMHVLRTAPSAAVE